jgi:hypothetical protein
MHPTLIQGLAAEKVRDYRVQAARRPCAPKVPTRRDSMRRPRPGVLARLVRLSLQPAT